MIQFYVVSMSIGESGVMRPLEPLGRARLRDDASSVMGNFLCYLLDPLELGFTENFKQTND